MFLERLMEVLAPGECLGCGADRVALCDVCLDEAILPSVMRPAELPPESTLAGVSVAARYDGAVKELIWRLKFLRLRAAAGAAAKLVLACRSHWPPADVVTAVPVAPARRRERGYNQSELVAREVARSLGVPYMALLDRKSTVHQIGLGRSDRLEQVAGAFVPAWKLENHRVLLVDDVVTTGATLSECAAVLRAAGAAEVWGAAVARHV